MNESSDSQKILNNLKRRVKELSKKSKEPITELYRTLAKEAGFQSWNEFTKNLAVNSHNPKVQKLISNVKERLDYKSEKNEETEDWMRTQADNVLAVIGFQWREMASRDRQIPLTDIAELLNAKNELNLPEDEGHDFFLAQRLANYYQLNLSQFESKIRDLFFRELAKLFLENKDHFRREFAAVFPPPLSSQNDLNWALTGVYESLKNFSSRNEAEDILYHLLRSSPNNELTAKEPARYPFPT